MENRFLDVIAEELKLPLRQVAAAAELLADGSTVPFIARYRKEATGSLDEVAITAIRDRLGQLEELSARRKSIIESLTERNLLTDELAQRLNGAQTMTELEDIYLPYRPKRRTRASIAKEKGLDGLAAGLLAQNEDQSPETIAHAYIHPELGVETVEQALAGARDIIAEQISEDQQAREAMRAFYTKTSVFVSKVIADKKEQAAKFQDYFEWTEPVSSAPSHRVLAMRRGENEGFLTLRVIVPREDAAALLESLFVKSSGACGNQVRLAIQDGFDRLLSPSMETEIRLESKKQADQQAIVIFADNLRQLLMASPLGQKNVMAIDPGFRTGCKVVFLDKQGKLLGHDVIYPHTGRLHSADDAEKVKHWIKQYHIEAIAIGNGTAGRETEDFIRSLGLDAAVITMMVNESGASIYSASEVARQEFADYDVTVRGAVSIGRRLMDPLAELVKIDPKSIGVGQYQHDVDQSRLKQSLDDIVISCVNSVGVEVNTASKELLMYVSGLGPALAQKIIEYRNEKGAFGSRSDLMNVPRLGAKAFEQAAGFLRIRDAKNPLDASAVHPESYDIVNKMAADCQCTIDQLIRDSSLRSKIKLDQYRTEKAGLETLRDILNELAKPGRDPRKQFEAFRFAEGVTKIEDLCPGMILPGIATNITAFGVFVDIGVHQDGLVHVSELADRFIKDPAEVVKVHQHLTVRVMEVDLARKRIKLSMKKESAAKSDKPKKPAPVSRPAPAAVSGKLFDNLTLGDVKRPSRN